MFSKVPLAESLKHVATPAEAIEFRELQQKGTTYVLGGPFRIGASELETFQQMLWPRARALLIEGSWRARGFVPIQHRMPEEVHPDLWHFLEPNRAFKCVRGGGFEFCGILVAGEPKINVAISDARVEQLDQKPANIDVEKDEGAFLPRPKLQRNLTEFFERLDKELPIHEYKPTFFERAREKFGSGVSEYLLLQAWGNAEVNPERKRPGLRKVVD